MAEKLVKIGIKRQEGYLYFIGRDGYVWKAKMARGDKRGGKKEKVVAQAQDGVYPIKKEEGYLYFVDKKGDISRAKMVRR